MLSCAWACEAGPGDSRDLGEDIDVEVDLPPHQGVDAGGFTSCDEQWSCIVGPSVRGAVVANASDLDALRGVRCIYGTLEIRDTELTDLEGLEMLEVVCGSVAIVDNPALVTTRGLDALAAAPAITIARNSRLNRLDFPAMVDGWFFIEENPSLADLSGLDALVAGEIRVTDCLSLTTVGPLLSLERARIFTANNPELTEIRGSRIRELGAFRSTNDGYVRIEMPVLETAESFVVERGEHFTGLDLPVAREIGRLELIANDAMTAVSVLPSVTAIEGIVLAENPALTSLAELEPAQYLTILNNATLDQHYAEEVASQLGGIAKVAGNAGWVIPLECPFSDGVCDAIGCAGPQVCNADADVLDCCDCQASPECPSHGE